MHEIFNPDKVNYGAYGDTGHHLYFHLVPKYKDGYEWGDVFVMNPGKKHCRMKNIRTWLKNIVLFFSIVHYDFF